MIICNFLFFFSSSQPNGNCLLSSISIAMLGSSVLVEKLRVMLCLELFLNSKFYASHPFLSHFFEKNKDQYLKLSTVLSYSISHSTFDSVQLEFDKLEFGNEEFVKREAILLCEDKVSVVFPLSSFSSSSFFS